MSQEYSVNWIADEVDSAANLDLGVVQRTLVRALKIDHGKLVKELMTSHLDQLADGFLDEALGKALKFKPFPSRALDAFMDIDPQAGKRLSRIKLGSVNYAGMEWKRFIPWLEKQNNIEEDIKQDVVDMVVSGVFMRNKTWRGGSDTDTLVWLANQAYCQTQIREYHHEFPTLLLSAAMGKDVNTELLEKIQQDIVFSLRACLEDENAAQTIWASQGTLDDVGEKWRYWERALEDSSVLRSGWETLQKQDERAVVQAREWIGKWVRGGVWQGSELEKWCQNPGDVNGSPLCPAILGKDYQDVIFIDHGKLAWVMQNSFAECKSGEGGAIKALLGVGDAIDILLDKAPREVVHKEADQGWIRKLCIVRPHLLSVCLMHGSCAIEHLAKGSREGKEELAKCLMDSRAAQAYFSSNVPDNLVSWLVEDPMWRDWRDKEGNTLTHAWIKERESGSVSWTMTKKIQRMFPQQLTLPNNNGICLLDREGVFPEKRKQQLARLALGQIAHNKTEISRAIPGPKM